MRSLALLALIAACSKPAPGVREVKVDELATMLAEGEATPVDTNLSTVRQRQGTIPGAILLSDFAEYSLAELPDDKSRPLVFYCVNEQCMASHAAAERARDNGYRDVAVLAAGISGWRAAGQRTE